MYVVIDDAKPWRNSSPPQACTSQRLETTDLRVCWPWAETGQDGWHSSLLSPEFSLGQNVNVGQSSDITLSSTLNKNTKWGLAGLGASVSPHRLHNIITTGVNGIYSSGFSGMNLNTIEWVHFACLFPLCSPSLRGIWADRYEFSQSWKWANGQGQPLRGCLPQEEENHPPPLCPWANLILSLFFVTWPWACRKSFEAKNWQLIAQLEKAIHCKAITLQ